MAEITRPNFTIPDGLPASEVPKYLRLMLDFVAQQTVKQAAEAEAKYVQKSDRVVADAVRVMEGEMRFDKAVRPTVGQVLYAQGATGEKSYYGVWGDSTTPAPTDPGPGPSVGAPHAILSATHTDSVAQAVSRGSTIYGNSTPAWDELVRPGSASVLINDATDMVYRTIPTTRSQWIWADEWKNGSVISSVYGQYGTDPDVYSAWAMDSLGDYTLVAKWGLPSDWRTGNVSVEVLWTTTGAVALNWVPYFRFLERVSGDLMTAAGTDVVGATTSTNFAADILNLTTVGTFSVGSVNRVQRLAFRRMALADANDNSTATVKILGVRLSYTPFY